VRIGALVSVPFHHMFEIGLDRADFDLLLDVLKGTHKRSRSEYAQQILWVALTAAVVALVASVYISDEAADSGDWFFWLGLAIARFDGASAVFDDR